MLIKCIRWFLSLFGIVFGEYPPEPEENITVETPEEVMVNPETITKKALLVGINKYAVPDADLNGCVNDVESMWNLIVNKFGFEPDNIRVLTDERATKEAILQRLQWLKEGAKAGDQLFFHNSSHGSQVRDRNSDELDDGLDEILIPHDHEWDNPLKDDDLAEIFRGIPEGVFLTVVVDACHSGTITREFPSNPGHVNIKNRFLPPPVDIAARSWGRALNTRRFGAKKGADREGNEQRHILISGCEDHQTSADALIAGRWGGALSVNLIAVLEEHPDWDWNHIHAEVVKRVKAGGYSQNPQLSGMLSLRERVPFGGAV